MEMTPEELANTFPLNILELALELKQKELEEKENGNKK